MKKIKKVFIFIGDNKDSDGAVRKEIEETASENGGCVVNTPEEADFFVVLGGDGTIMRAAHIACRLDKAVIGINLGRVGYMAELQRDEIHMLAQVFKGNYAEEKRNVYFMSIDGVKFRKVVKPGDQLYMHVEKIKERRNIFVFKGQTMVDGQVVSEAEFTAMIADK